MNFVGGGFDPEKHSFKPVLSCKTCKFSPTGPFDFLPNEPIPFSPLSPNILLIGFVCTAPVGRGKGGECGEELVLCKRDYSLVCPVGSHGGFFIPQYDFLPSFFRRFWWWLILFHGGVVIVEWS